jgi:inosose dehydratase
MIDCIGADTYVFSQEAPVAPRLDQVLRVIQRAGFAGVELMAADVWEDTARARTLVEQSGLEPLALFVSLPLIDRRATPEVEDLAGRALVAAQELRFPRLLVASRYRTRAATAEEREVAAARVGDLYVEGRQMGIEVLYHSYFWEFLDGARELDAILATGVGYAPDLDWASEAGVTPAEVVARYGDRIRYIHLRNRQGAVWTEDIAAGDLDLPHAVRELRQRGFSGPWVVELAYRPATVRTRSLAENLARSYQAVRAWLDQP